MMAVNDANFKQYVRYAMVQLEPPVDDLRVRFDSLKDEDVP